MKTKRPGERAADGLKAELVARLEAIPGITHVPWPGRDDGFSTIRFRDREIGHFHHFNELDLRLGRKLIRSEGLTHPPDSSRHPDRSANAPFVELRFDRRGDLARIIGLVELLTRELS